MPLKFNTGTPLTASEVLLKLTLAEMLSTTVADEPVRVPVPVQPLTVKERPVPVAVRFAVVIPLKPSDMPSSDASDVLFNVKLAALLAAMVSARWS